MCGINCYDFCYEMPIFCWQHNLDYLIDTSVALHFFTVGAVNVFSLFFLLLREFLNLYSNNKTQQKQAVSSACWFVVWLTLWSQRCPCCVPPKCQAPSELPVTILRAVLFKLLLIIVLAVNIFFIYKVGRICKYCSSVMLFMNVFLPWIIGNWLQKY